MGLVETYVHINPLFATVPLILAMRAMLPPFPSRIICRATAWAVMKTPVTLTSSILLQSSAVYSIAGVSCCMPAAAINPSSLPFCEAIPSTTLLRWSTSLTSTWW